MKPTIMIAVAAISTVTMLGGCKSKNHEKADLTSIHTTAATTAAPETLATTIPETTKAPATAASDEPSSAKGLSTTMETYQSNKVSIQYPKISGMTDGVRQDQVNQLLKDNANSYIKIQGVDESTDTLDISCKVISVDRKRITAAYTGTYNKPDASYPLNVFYTSTIDLEQAKNLGLNDFTDVYTMAGYVMSDDCEFYNVSPELNSSLLNYRADQSIESFRKLFAGADFSSMKPGGDAVFPESFSYTDKGVLYFSIPVPHALGDYAVIKFNLDGK